MNAAPPIRSSRPFRRWSGRFAFLYLLIVAAVTAWFWSAADENWIATLLLFGPRWAGALPLVLLLPMVLLTRSWWGLLWSGLAAAIVAGPFMGGVINFTGPLEAAQVDGVVRFMTFNADAKACDRKKFQAFIMEYQPDVVFLQDAERIVDTDLPPEYALIPAANGIKLASRHPAKLVGVFTDPRLGPARGAAKYIVSFPFGDHELATVHLPTPRPGLEAVLARQNNGPEKLQAVMKQRNEASQAAREWIGDTSIIAGDFNLPAESRIYRRDWSGYRDAFAECGLGWGWTMHSRRAAVRIDHILFAPPWECQAVVAGRDIGSSHLPVLADFMP